MFRTPGKSSRTTHFEAFDPVNQSTKEDQREQKQKPENKTQGASGSNKTEATMADDWSKIPDKLPQLTTDTYARWCYDIKIILTNRDLMKITNNDEKPPKSPDDDANQQRVDDYNKKVKEWLAKDNKAKEILTRSIDSRHHDMIRSCKYAYQIWNTLKTVYENKSGSSVLLTQREFHEAKWTEKDNVLEFFGRLRTIANRLEAMGSKMEDNMIVSKIITEAPAEFIPLKESWEVSLMTGAQLSLDMLLGQMVRVEKHNLMTKPKEADVQHGGAFIGKAVAKKEYPHECYNCGKKGHSKARCFAPGGGAYNPDHKRKGTQQSSSDARPCDCRKHMAATGF